MAPDRSRGPAARITLTRTTVLPLLLTALALAGPAAAERPSVVVVMTDDQTYADMAARQGLTSTR